ncbi:hypothetical protein ACG7TL_004563 [Trametes sanguinea]
MEGAVFSQQTTVLTTASCQRPWSSRKLFKYRQQPSTMRRTPALQLPLEIQQAIFNYLDRAALLRCMLTHRAWIASAQYALYSHAQPASPAALWKLTKTLETSPHLRKNVIELSISGDTLRCGVRPTDPILQIPAPTLLPNLRSLRFTGFDEVFRSSKSIAHVGGYLDVTELHLHRCRVLAPVHLEQLLYSFPHLTTLTLDSVRWAGDNEPYKVTFGQLPERALQLRTLRISNPYEYAPFFQWLIQSKCAVRVRHLELIRFDVYNLRPAGKFVTELCEPLESLTLGYNLPTYCDHGERRIDLRMNHKLRSLTLQIYDCQGDYVRWANTLLLSALESPLERIAFSLTLDSRQTLWNEAWSTLHASLTTYWPATLKEVAFTHYAVPGFLQNVEPLFQERFVELKRRRILSVTVVRSQDY